MPVVIIRKGRFGDIAYPIEQNDVIELVEQGKAEHVEGVIWREIEPSDQTYKTRDMKAEAKTTKSKPAAKKAPAKKKVAAKKKPAPKKKTATKKKA